MSVRTAVVFVLMMHGWFALPLRAQTAPPPVQDGQVTQPPDAAVSGRAAFDRGASLATAGRFQEAARAFEEAHTLYPSKEALFAWAQVERLAGRCARAVDLYRQFLGMPDVTTSQVEAAQLNVRRCERKMATGPGEPRAEPPPAPDRPTPVRPRWTLLGAALTGGSVLAAGAAVTFVVLSRRDERTATRAPVFDDYERAVVRARSRQRWALGTAAASLALGGAAAWELFWRSPAGFGEGPRLTWQPGALALGWGGRF